MDVCLHHLLCFHGRLLVHGSGLSGSAEGRNPNGGTRMVFANNVSLPFLLQTLRWHAPCTTSRPPPALTPMATPRPSPLCRETTSCPTCTPSTRPPTLRATPCPRPLLRPCLPTTSQAPLPPCPSTCRLSTRPCRTTSRPWGPPFRGCTSTRCCRGWRSRGAG